MTVPETACYTDFEKAREVSGDHSALFLRDCCEICFAESDEPADYETVVITDGGIHLPEGHDVDESAHLPDNPSNAKRGLAAKLRGMDPDEVVADGGEKA